MGIHDGVFPRYLDAFTRNDQAKSRNALRLFWGKNMCVPPGHKYDHTVMNQRAEFILRTIVHSGTSRSDV
jgi:hypothetical protein